jgi:hypothetical protein
MAPVPASAPMSSIEHMAGYFSSPQNRRHLQFLAETFTSRHLVDRTVEQYSNLYDHKDILKRFIEPVSQQINKIASSIAPRHLHHPARRDGTTVQNGYGTINPTSVNNKGVIWLFALLFTGLVLLGVWFFFWAKNGGFHFREGDWDDYKSTVLRRKGPNGTTLSGATKTTKLGQKSSISGESETAFLPHKQRAPMSRDHDVREYRHEKPARVGGLNRKADGSYYEHTNTDRSTVTFDTPAPASPSPPRPQKKSWFSRAAKKATPTKKQSARVPSATYSFTQGDDSVMSETTYHDERRQPAATPQRSSYAQPPPRLNHPSAPHRSAPRTASPPKRGPHNQYSYRARDRQPERETFVDYGSEYTYTDTSSDQGTKAYRHVIPGISSSRGGGREGGSTERSVPARGARNGAGNGNLTGGFRRGGGRRDSLSDSEGETVGTMPGSYE